jgi:glycosyltransferase involved in cell wall biosynthesis
MSNPKINLIVPLYNEQAVFESLIQRLSALIKNTPLDIEVILVDDGSKDNTPLLMRQLSLTDNHFTSVFLSRNFGHQLALTAGLQYVNATDAIMVIDGDLQDPPELLAEFYTYYQKGYDIVYAVRQKRKEGVLKRLAYKWFYKFLKSVSYIDIPLDSGDFSLISRRAVDILNKMPEESRFIRGMRSWIGFNQIGVSYERQERQAGDSKYPFKKLMALAFSGIFNFSEFPVKLLFKTGIFAVLLSLCYLGYTLFEKFYYHSVPSGFTALLFFVVLMGGLQLIAIGLLGEYILRIFFQVKNRPLVIIKEHIQHNELKNG